MQISGVLLRNVGGTLALAAFLVLSQWFAPPPNLKEARLSCTSGLSMTFEDMKACTQSSHYKARCACGPATNPWSSAYHWGLVPFLAALVAVAMLRGSAATRLLVLNGTVISMLLLEFIVGLHKHDSTAIAIPFFPIIAAVACGLITAWFLLLRLGHTKLRQRAHAT